MEAAVDHDPTVKDPLSQSVDDSMACGSADTTACPLVTRSYGGSMLPTVRQTLAMPVLAQADPEVLAGASHLDRPVRWLHPAEVDDIAPLLRGDEIVLTTGIALPDATNDPDRVRDYVRSLAHAGAAGLLIELGRTWQVLPETLVNACEVEHVVLIALHREVRFAAVVEEVGARILESEVEDLRASEHVHETFVRLDMDEADPTAILAAVVRIAGVPVVLESTRHQVIAFDTAERPPHEILADWSSRSRAVAFTGRTGYDRRKGWLTSIVGSRGDDWGRLILMTDRTPSRRDYVLVERAGAALVLHQLRSRARDSIERNTHTALLADLRSGAVSQETAIRCEAASFPVTRRQFVAVALRSRVAPVNTKQWTPTELAAIVASVGRTLAIPLLVGVDTDHVVALLSLPAAREVEATMTSLAREVRKQASVVIARGDGVDRLKATNTALIDARHILDASESDDPRPWITLADVHLRGLIHLLRHDQRLQLFVRRELIPLIDHDRERGTSLMTVLRVYLETPGGKAAAAKQLLVSRPVLYERLARIESVLGVNLEDPHIRTSLHVAILAWTSTGDATSGVAPQCDSS